MVTQCSRWKAQLLKVPPMSSFMLLIHGMSLSLLMLAVFAMSKYVSNQPLSYLVDSIRYLHFASDSDQIISGPSDVGGTCPDNTHLDVSGSKDLCCCGSNCCWNDCTLNQPPSNCLPDNTTEWIYSDTLGQYQVKRNMIYNDNEGEYIT